MIRPVVVVDLFCGMGGFTQGAIDAGAQVILSVDVWEEACKVHEANHPGTRIDCIELGDPDWYKVLLRFLKPYRRNFHIHLHGSPPCQALSIASRHDPEDGMEMVRWYLDLVKSVMPDSWSMENVVTVRKRLPEGTPNVILNSADFGVPQTRRRCYAGSGWVAETTHYGHKGEWISVIEALPHLVDELAELGLIDSVCVNTAGCGDSKSKGAITRDSTLDKPSKTLHNNIPSIRSVTHNVSGATESIGEAAENRDRVITKPSKVIRAHTTTLRDRREWDKPKKIRLLTIEETLVLQGFPADYDLSSLKTQKDRWIMVGNAVPPPVAQAVIKGIRRD